MYKKLFSRRPIGDAIKDLQRLFHSIGNTELSIDREGRSCCFDFEHASLFETYFASLNRELLLLLSANRHREFGEQERQKLLQEAFASVGYRKQKPVLHLGNPSAELCEEHEYLLYHLFLFEALRCRVRNQKLLSYEILERLFGKENLPVVSYLDCQDQLQVLYQIFEDICLTHYVVDKRIIETKTLRRLHALRRWSEKRRIWRNRPLYNVDNRAQTTFSYGFSATQPVGLGDIFLISLRENGLAYFLQNNEERKHRFLFFKNFDSLIKTVLQRVVSRTYSVQYTALSLAVYTIAWLQEQREQENTYLIEAVDKFQTDIAYANYGMLFSLADGVLESMREKYPPSHGKRILLHDPKERICEKCNLRRDVLVVKV